jgi:hypothetical protein
VKIPTRRSIVRSGGLAAGPSGRPKQSHHSVRAHPESPAEALWISSPALAERPASIRVVLHLLQCARFGPDQRVPRSQGCTSVPAPCCCTVHRIPRSPINCQLPQRDDGTTIGAAQVHGGPSLAGFKRRPMLRSASRCRHAAGCRGGVIVAVVVAAGAPASFWIHRTINQRARSLQRGIERTERGGGGGARANSGRGSSGTCDG